MDASVPSGSSKTVVSFTDSSVETTVSLTADKTFARRVFLSESPKPEIELIVAFIVSTNFPMI